MTDSLSLFLMSHSPFSQYFYRYADSEVKVKTLRRGDLDEVRILMWFPGRVQLSVRLHRSVLSVFCFA